MHAHDEERALWRAIMADWDDDTPRLAYADWLDEHDRPQRAELIRVQCAAERLPKDDLRRKELERRVAELVDWVQENGNWEDTWEFERGFVRHLFVRAGVRSARRRV